MNIKFDMIGIFVTDLKKMVTFYKDVIGLSIDWDENGPYAEFEHEGIRFSMFERKQLANLLGQSPSFPEGLNGTFELAINVGEPKNVDSFYNKVIKAGGIGIYQPRNEPWKLRSAMVADPDGNLIEIASDFWE